MKRTSRAKKGGIIIESPRLPPTYEHFPFDQTLEDGGTYWRMEISRRAFPSVGDDVSIEESLLESVTMSDVTAHQFSLSDCRCRFLDLSNSTLKRATFARVGLVASRLTGVSLAEVRVSNVVFEECKLDFAQFWKAKLKNVIFRRCKLQSAVFEETELTNVFFDECELRDGTFDAALLSSVSFVSSDVIGMRIELQKLKGVAIDTHQAAVLLAQGVGARVKELEEGEIFQFIEQEKA